MRLDLVRHEPRPFIAHFNPHALPLAPTGHCCAPRAAVTLRVVQRLLDDAEDRQSLSGIEDATRGPNVALHNEIVGLDAATQHSQREPERPFFQLRRHEVVDDSVQRCVRLIDFTTNATNRFPGQFRSGGGAGNHGQVQRHRREPLLEPVVQLARNASPLGLGGQQAGIRHAAQNLAVRKIAHHADHFEIAGCSARGPQADFNGKGTSVAAKGSQLHAQAHGTRGGGADVLRSVPFVRVA